MKKVLYFIIILFMCITITNAKSCTVVTGTGKNVGDEIACGTEHFYIISNRDGEVKMLAKYNLMSGTDYYRIKLSDFTSEYYKGFYKSEEVQEKLKDGWYVSDYSYDYSSTSNEYINFEIILERNADQIGTAIFFSENKTGIEIYEDPKVREYLNDGYLPFPIDLSGYSSSNSYYIGVILKKYTSNLYEYKTIFLDSEPITYFELYEKEEIKKLLDDGYYPYEVLDYDSCTISDTINYCDFYAVTFSKYKYGNIVNIMADKEYNSSNDLLNYLKENTDFQKYIDDGYGYYSYRLCANKYCNYIGVELYKYEEKQSHAYDILQNEKAIGAHGDEKGSPEPLEIGIVQMNYYDDYDDYVINTYDETMVYNGGYYDIEFNSDSEISAYLDEYKLYLENNGYNINNIDILTVKDVNNIIKDISNNELPLTEWYDKYLEDSTDWYDEYYIIGSIKEELPTELREKYNWLWGTTYWLKTVDPATDVYMYFIDTLGDLCTGFACPSSIGAGLRPVITMSSEDITYKITTKTDGNGGIKVIDTARDGEEVTFKITPEEGYVLGEVKVTDANGNVLTFTSNTFTMPSSDVTIEATFLPENPNTIDLIIYIIII